MHGFNALTSAEMASYKEKQAERGRAANDIFHDCFPTVGEEENVRQQPQVGRARPLALTYC